MRKSKRCGQRNKGSFSVALWKGVTGSYTVSVMAGLDPAIHVFLFAGEKTWMPGTRPGMTNLNR